MLIDELKKANVQAMKDRDAVKRAILSVVITKYNNLAIELKAKNIEASDNDLIGVIQKTIKELNDEAESYMKANRHDRAVEVAQQMAFIHNYLPKQLTEEEIKAEISKLEDKSMPSVMKHFKTNFSGKVDMSLVSKIARGN